MKSITGYTICQNEQHIIGYTIINPLLVLDKLVIIDGGSTDDTKKIIIETAERIGMSHKLRVYDKPFTTLNDQRNFALRKIDTEYAMYIDADETLHINDLQKIKTEYIEQYELILVHSNHYYIDWFHLAWSEAWHNSNNMPRIFKMYPGIKYTDYRPHEGDHTLLINGIIFNEFYKNKTKVCSREELLVQHYGHALGQQHEHDHLVWFDRYDNPDSKKLNDQELSDKIWQSSCYFDKRLWAGQNVDPKGIIPFKGDHPEPMKKHPLYGVHIITDDINTPNNTVWRRRNK